MLSTVVPSFTFRCCQQSTVEPLFKGHLHSGDTKFGPEKCSHNLCFCYLYWRDRTPLFREKGHFFWASHFYPPFRRHLSTQKVTRKEFELYNYHNDAFRNWKISIKSMYCDIHCRLSTCKCNITEVRLTYYIITIHYPVALQCLQPILKQNERIFILYRHECF